MSEFEYRKPDWAVLIRELNAATQYLEEMPEGFSREASILFRAGQAALRFGDVGRTYDFIIDAIDDLALLADKRDLPPDARMFFDEVSCAYGVYENYADVHGDDDLATRLAEQTPTAFWDAEDREIKYRQAEAAEAA